jgi:subtilase family serine protease
VYGDADDVVINTTRSVGSLASNTSSLATLDIHIRNATPTGYYYVCGKADNTELVTESNETNNTRCTTTRVQVRN